MDCIATTTPLPCGVDFLHVAPRWLAARDYDDRDEARVAEDGLSFGGHNCINIGSLEEAKSEAELAVEILSDVIVYAVNAYREDHCSMERNLRAALVVAYPFNDFHVFGMKVDELDYRQIGTFLDIEHAWAAASGYAEAWAPDATWWAGIVAMEAAANEAEWAFSAAADGADGADGAVP